MRNNELYWLALYYVLGAASAKVRTLMESDADLELLFSNEYERRICGIFSQKEIVSFDNALKKAEIALRKAQRNLQTVITPDDERYPQRLRSIYAPPAALFYRGVLPKFDDEVAIAMVGTRDVTEYGRNVAVELSMSLAKAGAIVVSGAAKGVDSYCHSGALQAFGRTAAVLGCGIDYPYLMENRQLRDTIEKNGVLISEYPPDTPATRWSFPDRNRIISGLTLGTVIIQAGIKSGSLITANYALEQGRMVFAVPGSVMSPSFEGTNKLLREGAKPVFSGLDVLEEFSADYPQKLDMSRLAVSMVRKEKSFSNSIQVGNNAYTRKQSIKKEESNDRIGDTGFSVKTVPPDLPEEDILVYNTLIAENRDYSVDELIDATGLSLSQLMRRLTSLELSGYVEAVSGNKYRAV